MTDEADSGQSACKPAWSDAGSNIKKTRSVYTMKRQQQIVLVICALILVAAVAAAALLPGKASKPLPEEQEQEQLSTTLPTEQPTADTGEELPPPEVSYDWYMEPYEAYEKEKEVFGTLLGSLGYRVTEEGLVNEMDELVSRAQPQQWFAAGGLPAYRDEEGDLHIVAPWREFVYPNLEEQILCATSEYMGAGDAIYLEDICILSLDAEGNLYWNRDITYVDQSHMVNHQSPYHHRPTALVDNETGHVIRQVEAAATILPEGGNRVRLRYVAEGMIYESENDGEWAYVAGHERLPVVNTGIRAEDLLTPLEDVDMIYKDTANGTVVIRGQAVALPEGYGLEQIRGAWSARWMSVILFEDGEIYTYGPDAGQLQYHKELSMLYGDGCVLEFLAPNAFGHIYAIMDDGQAYRILESGY